jgi:hypothetical protein
MQLVAKLSMGLHEKPSRGSEQAIKITPERLAAPLNLQRILQNQPASDLC